MDFQSSGFLAGEAWCWAGRDSGSGRVVSWCKFASFQRCFAFLDIESQLGGFAGLSNFKCPRAGSATRCGSEAWPMGGRWGVEVDWSEWLGDCCGLGVARPWIGGSLVGGGEKCSSVSAAVGVVVSSASA